MPPRKKSKPQEELAVIDLGISCCLSSAVPKSEELAVDYDPEDPTPVPVGWLRITVERILPNPEYLRLFQARESMIASSIEQTFQQALAAQKILTDEEKNGAIGLLRTNFEAQYKYALDTTPKYVTVEEECWVAPPENSKGLQKEWNTLADVLGVDLATSEAADDEKDGE